MGVREQRSRSAKRAGPAALRLSALGGRGLGCTPVGATPRSSSAHQPWSRRRGEYPSGSTRTSSWLFPAASRDIRNAPAFEVRRVCLDLVDGNADPKSNAASRRLPALKSDAKPIAPDLAALITPVPLARAYRRAPRSGTPPPGGPTPEVEGRAEIDLWSSHFSLSAGRKALRDQPLSQAI